MLGNFFIVPILNLVERIILPDDKEESLHHRSERRAMHIVTDAVFGLALGLGAFSLIEYPINTLNDIFVAIGFFALTFFLISLFWMWIRRFFEDFPIYGSGMTFTLWVLCFLVAILPFIMRLFFSGTFGGAEEVATFASLLLYPLDMGAIALLVGLLHVLFLKQGRSGTPWSDYKHIASDSIFAFILGVGFLFSAFLPVTMTFGELLPLGLPVTIALIPARFGIWIIIFLAAIPVYLIMEIIFRRMTPIKEDIDAYTASADIE